MREGIHPEYYQATVTCNCGNTFVTGSTKPEIHVEVCSKCHSFYTGQQKAASARGRIEKFNKKYGVKAEQQLYRCTQVGVESVNKLAQLLLSYNDIFIPIIKVHYLAYVALETRSR